MNTARTSSARSSLQTARHPLAFATCSSYKPFVILILQFSAAKPQSFSKRLPSHPHATPDTYYGAGPFEHKRLGVKEDERKREILAPNVKLRPGVASAPSFSFSFPLLGTLSPFPSRIPCLQSLRAAPPPPSPRQNAGRRLVNLSAPVVS